MAEEPTTITSASAAKAAKEQPATNSDVKGKGKAADDKPIAQGAEIDESDEEDEDMEEADDDEDLEEQDDMQEIDPSNIVSRRTRGRKIDFAKEAEAAGDELEDDDEEDEEYTAPAEEEK